MQFSGAAAYDIHTEMNNSKATKDISLAREFQKHLSDPSCKHGVTDKGKGREWASKKSRPSASIVSNIENMCHTHPRKFMCNITVYCINILWYRREITGSERFK